MRSTQEGEHVEWFQHAEVGGDTAPWAGTPRTKCLLAAEMGRLLAATVDGPRIVQQTALEWF